MTGSVALLQAQVSDKIRAEITGSVPKFTPPPAEPAPPAPVATTAPHPDEQIVQLPDFLVRETRVPDKDPDLWLSPHALAKKNLSDYFDSMTSLEWALNGWSIPILSASPQARANATYTEKKTLKEQKRLTSVAKILATMDSTEAKKLLRDLDLSSHPSQ